MKRDTHVLELRQSQSIWNIGRTTMAITANRPLMLLLLSGAAGLSYLVGFVAGFWLFIAVGVLFELAFWFELFGRRRRR